MKEFLDQVFEQNINRSKLENTGSIEVSKWVKRGSMIVSRDALHPKDPDSYYSYITKLGLVPEEFGYHDTNEPQMGDYFV
jgi:hypothetical protein